MTASLNRLHNISNQHQGQYKRVLCVCSAGLLRSPTAALVLSQPPFNCNTRAAGVADYALIRVDEVLLSWCDEIVCMDGEQANQIDRIGGKTLGFGNKPCIILGIEDRYAYRNADLIDMIKHGYKEAQGRIAIDKAKAAAQPVPPVVSGGTVQPDAPPYPQSSPSPAKDESAV